ncbi:hypothetical protein M407DRAFT_21612 [Tulasnella calospora MUT 4182]|uniref:CBM1 domain-containing protein n=1 Tax=Tulasnella calospora MUT 4182 TaxID=1051891 RepID=A0A0C3QDS9_9AGAM|nr:hypothetical protein M407DRAFT_21612 [Tulasnella calospora MUT 4182]
MKAAVAFIASLFAAAHAGPVTTTTTPRYTSTGATTTTTASGALQTHYGQCGGLTFTGPTVCAPPYTCIYAHDWFSQCL